MGWMVGWGGVGGGAGAGGMDGVGGGKNHYLGQPMSSHNVHTVANDTIVGHIRSQWKQTQVPTA